MSEKTDRPEQGIYYDVPMSDYRAWPAVNYSSISKGRHSLRAMHKAMTAKSSTASVAQGLGTAVHAAILEPEVFEEFPTFDGSRKTKAFKEFEVEQGQYCLTKLEKTYARLLDGVVRDDARCRYVIEDSVHEACLVWHDERYGWAKMRVDMLGHDFMADVKTGREITAHAMNRAFFSTYGWGYFLQWGWALEAFEHLRPDVADKMKGYLIAVATPDVNKKEDENFVPDAYCAEIEREAIEAGRDTAVSIASNYYEITKSGSDAFPGVSGGARMTLRLPNYMKTDWKVGE